MMIFVFDRVENIVGKGENADDQYFLRMFSYPFTGKFKTFKPHFSFAHGFNFDKSKILLFSKELMTVMKYIV